MSSNNSAGTLIAGGVSGAVAKTVGAPLARVTILQQTAETRILHAASSHSAAAIPRSTIGLSRHILAQEGIRGFFRGNAVDMFRSLNYSAISYWCYEGYKSFLVRRTSLSSDGVAARMLAGGSAGVTAVLVTYPLDVCRTRLCVSSSAACSSSIFSSSLRSMLRTRGLSSLYRGSLVAACHSFPNLAINWAVFESCRGALARQGRQGLPYSLASGVAAGVVANTITYPLDVVMKSLQADVSRAFSSPAACAAHLWTSSGIRAFYAGYAPQLCKSVPICATSFAVYDQMKRWMALAE